MLAVPSAHGRHAALALLGWCVPGGHGVHVALPVPLYDPALHAPHPTAEMSPVALLNVPPGHGRQSLADATDAFA